MTLSWLLSQRSLDRPPVVKAAGDDALVPTKVVAPLLDVHSLSVECQKSVVAPVIGLLFSGCPPTVLWRVIALVVDAVKPSTSGGVTHVGIKVGEGCTPAIAHSDTACTVADKGRVFFVITAAQHSRPCAVFAWLRRFAQVVTSCSRSSLALRLRQAAAGLCSSALQVVRSGYLFTTAVARTFPQRLPAFRCSGVARSNQLSKPHPSQISVSHSIGIRSCVPLIIT